MDYGEATRAAWHKRSGTSQTHTVATRLERCGRCHNEAVTSKSGKQNSAGAYWIWDSLTSFGDAFATITTLTISARRREIWSTLEDSDDAARLDKGEEVG
jgi:hypothetical protein